MRALELMTAFVIGAIGYVIVEIIYRGYSHISMAAAGGCAFMLLHGLFTRYGLPIWSKCIIGAFLITCIEFITGFVVNIKLRLNVWDYSGVRLNLYGQVCLRFSMLWLLLTIPLIGLSQVLHALLKA